MPEKDIFTCMNKPTIDPKNVLYISAKCSDLFSMSIGEKNYVGYVPDWLPNSNVKHYGDYVELKIDITTGQIINWKQPTQAQLDKTFDSMKQLDDSEIMIQTLKNVRRRKAGKSTL